MVQTANETAMKTTLSAMAGKAAQFLRLYFHPEWRLARSKGWQARSDVIQPWPLTRTNRHPDFFDLVARTFEGQANIRILSFGCATGEEVFALSHRMPDAHIDGIDVNAACIKKARRQTPDDCRHRVHFEIGAAPPDLAEHYDAIFCLSVLRHAKLDAERPQSCEAILPFARYAETIAAFDRALKPDGLLIVWGSNFLFEHSKPAARYRWIEVPGRKGDCGAVYGPDNQLLPIDNHHLWVFRKIESRTD
jgi:2-polyprenyl-3-methyl-5-hydroxy-6-metoxy-1,4-benzoquinol methylase